MESKELFKVIASPLKMKTESRRPFISIYETVANVPA